MFDRTRSYSYDDVESKEITYEEFICSQNLDFIAKRKKVLRSKIAEYILHTYGGILEIAILDYYRNTLCVTALP